VKLKSIKIVEPIVLLAGGLAATFAFLFDEANTLWHLANIPYIIAWVLWLWFPYALLFAVSFWLRRVRNHLAYSLLSLGVALLMLIYTLYEYSYVLREVKGGPSYYWLFSNVTASLIGIVAGAMVIGGALIEAFLFHKRRA
jgi:hypothetical protein